MGRACSAVLLCVFFALTARADNRQLIAVDDLPSGVAEAIRDSLLASDLLLHVWKENEDGKVYYTVVIDDKSRGREIEILVSPDGRFSGVKKRLFSIRDLPDELIEAIVFTLLPGVIGAAVARWLSQVILGFWKEIKSRNATVLAEWSAAWAGGAIVIGVLLSTITTVPREKDVIGIAARCLVWGGLWASFVEMIGICVQRIRKYRTTCGKWILAFCLLSILFLSLSIPAEVLHKARFNQYIRSQALRYQTK